MLQWFTYTETKQKSWECPRDFLILGFITIIKWEFDE